MTLAEDRRIVTAGYVDDGVEGDDGIEALVSERERAEVAVDEVGAGHPGVGERQLARREVESDHSVLRFGEELHHRHAGAAPRVEHPGAGSQSRQELAEHRDVATVAGSVGEVGLGDVVVAASDHPPWFVPHRVSITGLVVSVG